MSTKTFKIGEYALGGIVNVTAKKERINIQCLSWGSKRVVLEESLTSIQDAEDFLERDVTSYYYAQKIMDWLRPAFAKEMATA